MAEIRSGLLIDGLVTQKIVSNIEHPGLDFKKIEALIIHQTDSYNAVGTIGYWGKSTLKAGAHFIIDRGTGTAPQTKQISKKPPRYQYTGKIINYGGTDGKIYQTAHLDKRCNHAGKLRDKKYPNNYNSIGIEFVSKYDEVAQTYPPPSIGQIQSGAWLVKTLLELIKTISSTEAVYAHGVIAFKTPDMSEGGSTLEKIKEELKPKEIKIEGSCPEFMQQLFPFLCNQPGIFSPQKKP